MLVVLLLHATKNYPCGMQPNHQTHATMEESYTTFGPKHFWLSGFLNHQNDALELCSTHDYFTTQAMSFLVPSTVSLSVSLKVIVFG